MAQSFRKILKKDKVKPMNLRQIKTYDTIKLYFSLFLDQLVWKPTVCVYRNPGGVLWHERTGLLWWIMPLPLLGDGFFIFRSHKRKENLYEQGWSDGKTKECKLQCKLFYADNAG